MEAPRARAWRPGQFALILLTVLAVIAAAKVAEAFLIPVVAGIVFAYALKPLVSALHRMRIPRPAGAAFVLLAVTALVVGAALLIRDDVVAAVAELPYVARKVRMAAHENAREPTSPIGHVREAAAELNRAAAEAAGTPPQALPPPPAGSFGADVQAWTAAQSSKIIVVLTDLGVAALLAYFVLSSGDMFRRKLVHIAGPTLKARRVTAEILDEIDGQVQRYLLVVLGTNILLAIALWLLLTALGLQRAAMWASIAGVLHFIPYAGTAMTTGVIAIAAFLQFDSLGSAGATAASVFIVSAAIGMGLQTWLQGRAHSMNAVVVFIALIFFGWLWGGWGLILGGPLIAILRTIADRVPEMEPIASLLSR